jgi:hypothetical protein
MANENKNQPGQYDGNPNKNVDPAKLGQKKDLDKNKNGGKTGGSYSGSGSTGGNTAA